MKLSIIIPTVGRDSLQATLESVVSQTHRVGPDADEVLVIGGPGAAVAPYADAGCRHLPCPPGGDWGCVERTKGIAAATGTHLAFIDDDDVWVPGARLALAHAMADWPDRLALFRMRYRKDGAILWDKPVLRVGNVSTQMILVPNDPARLGRWTTRREGDFDFISSCQWPEQAIAWYDNVIAEIGRRR